MERKLASIQRILDIQPIEGADKIVRATINGWHLVTAVDNRFKVGDLVIYLEVDSWVPTELAPFLSKGHEPREFEGVKGERLKTIKLRGQVSQGLIMPLSVYDYKLYDENGNISSDDAMYSARVVPFVEGEDVTEHLGVKKWEKALAANLQGKARGNFPSFIHKTDQERCQNIPREINTSFEMGEEFEITEKLDGSSMTVYHRAWEGTDENNDISQLVTLGVCSRNLDLKLDQEGNAFVDMAKSSGLLDALLKLGRNIAVQGELYGEGIQGNNEKIAGKRFAVFDIFDIDTSSYLLPDARYDVLSELMTLGANVEHIKFICQEVQLPSANVADLLKLAEGKNDAGNEREGLVFKSMIRDFSFKAISNKFLLGEE